LTQVGEPATGPAVAPAKKEPEKKLQNARLSASSVKCGDQVSMRADVVNIPSSTEATFLVKAISDGDLDEVKARTGANSVEAKWVSQKPSGDWNGSPEVKFSVSASSLQAESAAPQLSFFKYPDYRPSQISARMSTKNFGWHKKATVEFKNRKLIISVEVQLLNRTQDRPTRKRKENYGDWRARCEAVPIGGTVPDAAKAAIKATVEGVYAHQLYLHRKGCKRLDGCECPIDWLCCKFAVEVKLNFVETPGPMTHRVNLWLNTGRENTSDWFRRESWPGTAYAHEVGHLMGFYDEYKGGATTSTPPWKEDDPVSLMGRGRKVYDYHLNEYRKWFVAQTAEEFKLRRVFGD